MEVLTHSKRRDFKNCHRYYFHRHIEHLTPRKQKRGRRRGTVFGDALQVARLTHEANPEQFEIEDAARAIDVAVAAMYDEIRDTGLLDATEIEELDVEEVKVRVMARRYIEIYGIDTRRELEYELPFKNPATGRSSRAFRLGGKIDGLIPLGNNHAAVVEDKFVGQIQKAMIDRLQLDDQASEYISALNQRGWTGEVRYRHTLYPQINPRKEKIPPEFTPSGKPSKAKYVPPETLQEFEDRLYQDTVDREDHYFDEQILPFPSDHMADYRSGRWATAQDILAKRRAKDLMAAFYMNPSRCWEYGGCEFIPLCTKVEDARVLYVVQEDNPELEGGVTREYATNES